MLFLFFWSLQWCSGPSWLSLAHATLSQPCLVTWCWYLEICCSRRICTMEISKCCTSGLSPPSWRANCHINHHVIVLSYFFPGKFPFILQDSVFLCEAFFDSHRGMGRRKQLLCAKHLGWVLYIHNSHASIKTIVSHYNYLFVIAPLISAEGKDCSLYWCFKPRGL